MTQKRDAATILHDAAETLQTAEWGLADLLGEDPRRRLPGLRNVVVFGHATTQALQNLRTVMREDFDEWYAPKQEAMRQDELLKYFWDLRSVILKEGTTGQLSTSTYIEHLNTADLQPLMQNPPPGAKGFFIGDSLGGSGWEVELPDGNVVKYYVTLPKAVKIESTLHFAEPPATHKGQQLGDTSIEALSRHYVAYLSELVREAKEHFTR